MVTANAWEVKSLRHPASLTVNLGQKAALGWPAGYAPHVPCSGDVGVFIQSQRKDRPLDSNIDAWMVDLSRIPALRHGDR